MKPYGFTRKDIYSIDVELTNGLESAKTAVKTAHIKAAYKAGKKAARQAAKRFDFD